MGKRKSQTNQSQAAKRNCRNNNRIEDSDSETEGFEQNDVSSTKDFIVFFFFESLYLNSTI